MAKFTSLNSIALIILACAVLLGNLGGGSLSAWDESLYAQVSREMYTSGNWIDLTWLGLRWSDKPPLYMWATAFFYKLLGVNEFSARLFSALSGIATVLVTYALANTLYSRAVAWCSSLILISTWHFIWSAKTAMLDVALGFFTSLALLFFIWGEKKKQYFLLTGIAFALAFLTKSFASAVIPVIILAYLVFSRKFSFLKEPWLWGGIGVAFVILFAWHWLVFSHYGKGFINDYFLKHLLTRTSTAMEGHTGNIFTYLKVIPNKGRPWGALGFLSIVLAGWEMSRKKEKNHLLILVWVLVVLGMYSVVKTKLHWYIVPLYPALSIASGWCVCRIFKRASFWMMPVLCFASIAYLASAKGIFNPDYSPLIKKMAFEVKALMPPGEKVFIYNVGDPAVRFYFGDNFVFVTELKEVEKLAKEEGNYFVSDTGQFSAFPQERFSVVYQDRYFTAAKTSIPK